MWKLSESALFVVASMVPAVLAMALGGISLARTREDKSARGEFLFCSLLLGIALFHGASLAVGSLTSSYALDSLASLLYAPALVAYGWMALGKLGVTLKAGWVYGIFASALALGSVLIWFPVPNAWLQSVRQHPAVGDSLLLLANGPARWIWAGLGLLGGLGIAVRALLADDQSPTRRLAVGAGALLLGLAFAMEVARPWVLLNLGPMMGALGAIAYRAGFWIRKEKDGLPFARDMAFDHMGDGVIVVDQTGVINEINPAALQLFGISAKRALGRKLEDLSFTAELKDLVGLEGTYELEMWEFGQQRVLRASVRKIPLPGRKRSGSVIVLNDVTDRMALERSVLQTTHELQMALHQAEQLAEQARQANDAKTKYLATISHEIRTPLNGLIGMTELLQRTSLTDEQRDQALLIQKSGQSLLRLLNDVLDISKIEAGHMSIESVELDLGGLVQEVAEQHRVTAAEKGVSVTVAFPTGAVPPIYGDPLRLRQILHNLLSNAVRFTERGFIRVQVERRPGPEDRYACAISVADSGIGIEPNRLSTIFEDYEQADASIARKYGGTGLGLSITKQLVELMGGRISVRSKLGEGSTFTVEVTFPYATYGLFSPTPEPAPAIVQTPPVTPSVMQEPAPSFIPQESATSQQPRDLRILVAEDDEVSVLVVSGQLEYLGCQYEIARDGAQALRAARNQQFDLVFMDMHMPLVDGLTATRELRAEGYRGPIVAMTASVEDEAVRACLEAGMNGVVGKPISADAIVKALKEHTGYAVG